MPLPQGEAHNKAKTMATNEHLCPLLGAPVNGTDDREAHPRHWVAALVQVRSEKAVGKKLQALGIENYVPTQWEIHQWSDRKKKVERVIIPMIVFIRTEKAHIKRLILHPFIHKLITYPGQHTPAIIPDAQVESLKYMLRQSDAPVEMRERIFKTGDHVRIVRGPLKNLEGELCRVESEKSMVAILIDCLGYACVSIDQSDIETLEKNVPNLKI